MLVWAINAEQPNNAADKKTLGPKKDSRRNFAKGGKYFRRRFMARRARTFVSTETPVRLNDRLAVQRGVFLCPGDVTKTFIQNLTATGMVEAFEIEIAKRYRRHSQGCSTDSTSITKSSS